MNIKESRIGKYLLESKAELKKVTWPTKKETSKHTLVVIGMSLFVAAFLGLLDFIFARVLDILL